MDAMHELELGNTRTPAAYTEDSSWMEKHIAALLVPESNIHQERLAANLLCSRLGVPGFVPYVQEWWTRTKWVSWEAHMAGS